MRADRYWFNTDSDEPANSGSARDFLVSPKFALSYGPWRNTEWFVNAGRGFHSNDARGTVARVDHASGDPASPVDPLVRPTGVETGIRGTYFGQLNSSISVWALELDSELVFVGDAGTTEPSRKSRRYGIEIAHYYRVTDWLTLDLDLAFTDRDSSTSTPTKCRIPLAGSSPVARQLIFLTRRPVHCAFATSTIRHSLRTA